MSQAFQPRSSRMPQRHVHCFCILPVLLVTEACLLVLGDLCAVSSSHCYVDAQKWLFFTERNEEAKYEEKRKKETPTGKNERRKAQESKTKDGSLLLSRVSSVILCLVFMCEFLFVCLFVFLFVCYGFFVSLIFCAFFIFVSM